MRIASLVPSATELLFALGLGANVVAITHECDYPPDAKGIPQLTRSVVPDGLSAPEIDAAVRQRTQQGQALYELDEAVLAELEPELIVTQAVCEVCAVAYDDVAAAAARLRSEPEVISLDPSTLGEVMHDITRLAQVTGAVAAGHELAADAARRIDAVTEAVADAPIRRVAALEWLDPVFIGGHWVPQMIELAGGEDVLGLPGERSWVVDWQTLAAAGPEIIVSMPCGYATEGALEETCEHSDQLCGLHAPVAAVDASAYFSRPGPRLVDGIELLGHLLHPEEVPEPPAGRFAWVELDRVGSAT